MKQVKKVIWIDDTEISLFYEGTVLINTHILVDDDNWRERVIATTDTFKGERFTWVGNFLYERIEVIG